MKLQLSEQLLTLMQRVIWVTLSGTFVATAAHATSTDLASSPLANSATASAKPNIMFILDTSGSMGWDYLPDYVNDSYCKGSSSTLQSCNAGDPPYFSTAFNGVYYNPNVYYKAPIKSDGSYYNSMTSANTSSWTSVPNDGFGAQFSGTKNLVTSYPERVWCNSSGSTCKSAVNSSNVYTYPDSTYKYVSTVYGAPYYYTTTVLWCKNKSNTTGFGSSSCQAKKTSTYKYVQYGGSATSPVLTRTNIVSSNNSYPKGSERVDCAGSTCTYAEEMTNFANWYAYYRTRLQMMKSAAGLAFAPMDQNYRIGFVTIDYAAGWTTSSNKFLGINDFGSTQRETWYEDLYAMTASNSTPLREALSYVGRIYAGQVSPDPVQYSCQKNFSILSTDGYWNGTSGYKTDGTTQMDDQDGVSGVTRPSKDDNQIANTLADVAYYYYHNDLRTSMTDNVPPTGTDQNVDDVATWQHMTTYTIGLIDGTLTYQSDYKTATSGDYYNILQGTASWPIPGSDKIENIDDLWHAAVNGRGTYYSARDPSTLSTGLSSTLTSIKKVDGSSAAAATSSLNPVAGDNFAYVASYTTVLWTGDLSSYSIDLNTGALAATPTWSAATQLNGQVGASTDSRTIYVYDSTNANNNYLKPFAWGSLNSTEQGYFNDAVSKSTSTDSIYLSQYLNWTSTQKTAATGETLVNYLRGQTGYEEQSTNTTQLYRDRQGTLGDIGHSQPVYVKAPPFNYVDPGYNDGGSSFKSQNSSRAAVVYVSANDGMLHAFSASTGSELWSYIPPMVLPDLWRLADDTYANNHRYYVDGTITIGDVCVASCTSSNSAVWKTILVGGLGAGGRGFYALDVTNPGAPKALWNFTTSNDSTIGYSYGNPVITKRKSDGKWVVLLTSGFNNTGPGDGQGYLYVLDANTGQELATNGKLGTGVGDTGTPDGPSGLSHIANWVDNFAQDNSTQYVYGGDLLGNMWRFDLNAGSVLRMAEMGSGSNVQPVTTRPELMNVNGVRVMMFGTGRYLGFSDLSDTSVQSFYAVKDSNADNGNLRTNSLMVKKTVTTSGNSRYVTSSAVDWSTKLGWYLDLPDTGERVSVDPLLVHGTLTFSSVVPNADACNAGGYSWLYSLDALTGNIPTSTTVAAQKIVGAIVVGVNIVTLPGGKDVGIITKSDRTTQSVDIPTSSSPAGSKRVSWREIFND